MQISVEFSGGLELLFGGVKAHSLELPHAITQVKDLVGWIRDTLLTSRPGFTGF